MTRAAYCTAIAWSAATGCPLTLECDVHLSADDQLICLHDLALDRTSNARGLAGLRTVAELRRLDFGSWFVRRATADQRALITLEELVTLVVQARAAGTPVGLAVETKHPNPRGLAVEERLADLLRAYGWDQPGSPVRLLSFAPEAMAEFARRLPDLPRTFLIQTTFGSWVDGHLPPGVSTAGLDLALIRQDPGYVARTRVRGHTVDVWTVNDPAEVVWCVGLGVCALTTDDPAMVAAALAGR